MEHMKAVIYTRVSQDSRGDSRSVQEQEQECRAWVTREDWETLGVWVDNDVSASKYSTKARPGWQALTERLEVGDVDVLVVWEPSRATRDRRVWAALAAICEERRVRFGCNGRVYDLADPDDAFQLDLFFALATRESGATRKRVLRSTRANAATGRPHGKLLFGYRRTYREGSRGPELVAQVVDDEQGAIVREAARRVMAGESLSGVAKDLNARGITGPRGGTWDPTQVRRLCVNPSYIAKRTHQGQVVGDAQWPPILTEATYYACLSRLTDPGRRSNEGRGVRHLLTGLATCGVCGGRMGTQKNRGHYAYHCLTGGHVSRKIEPVEELVMAVVIERLARPDALDLLRPPDLDGVTEQAMDEATEKRARLNGFYDAAASGELTPAALARIEARLLPEIAAADKRARRTVGSPLLAEVAGPDVRTTWARLTIQQRREVVAALCDVTILPWGRGRRTFDPASVQITWKAS